MQRRRLPSATSEIHPTRFHWGTQQSGRLIMANTSENNPKKTENNRRNDETKINNFPVQNLLTYILNYIIRQVSLLIQQDTLYLQEFFFLTSAKLSVFLLKLIFCAMSFPIDKQAKLPSRC